MITTTSLACTVTLISFKTWLVPKFLTKLVTCTFTSVMRLFSFVPNLKAMLVK